MLPRRRSDVALLWQKVKAAARSVRHLYLSFVINGTVQIPPTAFAVQFSVWLIAAAVTTGPQHARVLARVHFYLFTLGASQHIAPLLSTQAL